MLIYKREQLAENELESRIIKYPELIEDGLKYLEHQRQTPSGRLDILFIDSNNTLVVAELKVVEDPDMLFQALDYFDFASEKIEGFANIYSKKHKIDVSKYARLMLIAPSFSSVMINRCRWLNPEIRITLIAYQYITFSKINEDTLVFIPQEFSIRPTVLKKPPELDELLKYIRVKNVRELAKRFLEETKELSEYISVDPLQWGKSVKYRGTTLYYWEPRQNFIRISTNNEDQVWTGFNIANEEEYNTAFNLVRSNFEKEKRLKE